jgi:hypothetical protein
MFVQGWNNKPKTGQQFFFQCEKKTDTCQNENLGRLVRFGRLPVYMKEPIKSLVYFMCGCSGQAMTVYMKVLRFKPKSYC